MHLQALTCLLEESQIASNLSRKATLLLAEILALANRVLPMNAAAGIQVTPCTLCFFDRFLSERVNLFDIQAIPEIFVMATDYKDGEHRIVGTSALSAIESFNRNRTRLDNTTTLRSQRPRLVFFTWLGSQCKY